MGSVFAAEPEVVPERFVIPAHDAAVHRSLWEKTKLSGPPQVYPVTDSRLVGDGFVRGVFFEGEMFQGRPTRIFAWVGVPAHSSGQVPGMVLVHGGGGTAFRSWVESWVSRGYAAIAMDTCGATPAPWLDSSEVGRKFGRVQSPDGGPEGWGGFEHVDQPVTDQWPFQAVGAVIRAHSLLRSLPQVDANRIGLTGISWGGFLANIVAGVDDRLAFVAPVYGCGFLGEDSSWQETVMQEMGRERAVKWLTLWDPSQWLGQSRMPMLFCNGTNDRHYRPDSWQKTYRLASSSRTLSLKVRMPHGHPPEGDPREITVFADSLLQGRPALPRILAQGREGREAWASFASEVEVTQAELVYTTDDGNWVRRRWNTLPAEIRRPGHRVSAAIPAAATVYYLNLRDARGCIVSTEHEELSEGP